MCARARVCFNLLAILGHTEYLYFFFLEDFYDGLISSECKIWQIIILSTPLDSSSLGPLTDLQHYLLIHCCRNVCW